MRATKTDRPGQESSPQAEPKKGEKFKINHTLGLKLAYVTAIALIGLLFVDPSRLIPQNTDYGESIAIVIDKQSQAKVKHPRSSTWSPLYNEDRLYPNSMIFTGDNSFVKIALVDASIISLGPNSLLRLRMIKPAKKKAKPGSAQAYDESSFDGPLEDEGGFQEDAGVGIEVDGGNIDVQTSKDSKLVGISTNDSMIKVAGGSQVSLNNSLEKGGNTELAVKKGGATLSNKKAKKTVKLKSKQKVSSKKLEEQEEEKASEEVVEKIKSSDQSVSSFGGEKYEFQRKGILQVLTQMAKIILFLD